MPNWKKLVVSGSNAVLNQVTASSFLSTTVSGVGFVGSASYAETSSYITGSVFTTTNLALSSSYAITASFALNGGGSSTPGGPIKSIQFNKASQLTGSGKFIYDEPVDIVVLSGSFKNVTTTNINILDTSQRATYDAVGSQSIDWGTSRLLLRDNGSKAVQWGSSLLTSGSANRTSVDWSSRTTNDSNESASIYWGFRQLMDIDGTTVKIWWANGRNILVDDGASTSVDWGQRLLLDAGNNNAADWANRSLVGNDGITISVDWASGILYDTPGVPSIEWASRRLADVSGQPALDYADTTTNNGVRLYGTASYAISASHLIGGGGSGATFNGGTNVNNRLITATSTTPELNGEANLTFDGSTLLVTGSLTVSGSSTLTNIGPAVFSGSVVSTTGFTGSLSGSVIGTATTASYINGMILKNNAVGGGSFTGNPKKYTVTFSTAFPNTSYSVTVTGEDSRTWTIESKLAGSFVINSNSNTALANNVYWQAISTGEFNS